MTVVKTRRKPTDSAKVTIAKIVEDFKTFRAAKTLEAQNAAIADTFRKENLLPAIEKLGHPYGDNNQHLAIELPEPVDGFIRLVRRANVSSWFDIEKATELAKELGITRRVSKSRVSVNWEGTPRDANALVKKLVAAGLTEDDVQVDTEISQALLYAYHLEHKDQLTESMLDGLIQHDVRYSFNPDKA